MPFLGTLPDQLPLSQLKEVHTSHSRNPLITRVFFRRGLIENLGTGIRKIINICAASKMKPPEFFEQSGTFIVRVYSRRLLIQQQPVLTDYAEEIHKQLPYFVQLKKSASSLSVDLQEKLESLVSDNNSFGKLKVFADMHETATSISPRLGDILLLLLLSNKPLPLRIIIKNLELEISDRTLKRDLNKLKELEFIDTRGKGRSVEWFIQF